MTAEPHARADNFWNRSKQPRAVSPPLAGDIAVDVAIIGAGYTGLATAYHLKAADPSLNVAILESETVGFGASGRNAGFVMTLFGASVGMMKGLHGGARVREAHDYMVQSIDALAGDDLASTISIAISSAAAFSRSPPRRATRRASATRSPCSRNWVSKATSGSMPTPWPSACARRPFSAAAWSRCAAPSTRANGSMRWPASPSAKARGSTRRRASTTCGVCAGKFRLATPGGNVTADKVVFATNGYTHLIPGMRSKEMPAFAFIVVSEPLSPEQRAAIGWAGREGIEDGRNFMHFYRLTPDNRILMGGGPGFVPFNGRMDHDAYPAAWQHLEDFIGKTFPALRGIRIEYRWGGGVLGHRQFDAADRHACTMAPRSIRSAAPGTASP